MIDKHTGSPLGPRVVTVKGMKYSVKATVLAELMWDEAGVDIGKFLGQLRDNNGRGAGATYLKLFAATTAHVFVAMNQEPWDAQRWATEFDSIMDEDEREKTMQEAFTAAVGCVLESVRARATKRLKLVETATQEPEAPAPDLSLQ